MVADRLQGVFLWVWWLLVEDWISFRHQLLFAVVCVFLVGLGLANIALQNDLLLCLW